MHVPVTKLRAMEALAEKYASQFEKLLAQEEAKGAAAPLLDSEGVPVRVDCKVKMPDGSIGPVIRLHAPSRRAVVRTKDRGDRAVMVHRLKVMGAKKDAEAVSA